MFGATARVVSGRVGWHLPPDPGAFCLPAGTADNASGSDPDSSPGVGHRPHAGPPDRHTPPAGGPMTATHRTRDRLTAGILGLVHSNLFISLAATGVAVSTTVLAGFSLDTIPLFIVFAVTLFVYSFNRLADLAEDEQNVPGRATFVRRYGTPLLVAGGLLYLAAVAVAIWQSIPYAPAMGLPLAVAVLYSVLGLKRVLLVKNLLVGLSWGAIPLGVGVYYDRLWTLNVLFLFGFITVMLTIAAVVFDIKDIEGDRAEGIQTVPIVVGPRRTRQFAAAATAGVALVVAALILAGVLALRYVTLLAFCGYVFGYSFYATEERTPLFYGFVVDGEHVFLAALVLAWRFASGFV